MNEIKLKGRIASLHTDGNPDLAEILLPPLTQSDLNNLKEGDEVLLRVKVIGVDDKFEYRPYYFEKDGTVYENEYKDCIVAILPKESEYCECIYPDKFFIKKDPNSTKENYWICRVCDKPVKPPNHSEPKQEIQYPCLMCGKLRTKDGGKLRTKDEGGTTFTVCDECWDKTHKSKKYGFGTIRVKQESKIKKIEIPAYCEDELAHKINELIDAIEKLREVER